MRLRAPAVPLITVDPFFSVWSPADKLTDVDTTHWTGFPNIIVGIAEIDGKPYRIIGRKRHADINSMKMVSVDVDTFTTTYVFEQDGVRLSLLFTAPILPDGLIYTRAADPDSPSYLTDTLFSALYGEAARGLFQPDTAADGEPVPPIGDAALFLSISPYPCELAVFRCSDLRSASTVAGLCRTRLDMVERGYRGSEWEAVAQKGKVSVDGCYVLLAVAEDPDAVLASAKRLLP